MKKLKAKDLISLNLLTIDEINLIIEESDKMKNGPRNTNFLQGKTLAMIFEKSSTRTRVSFETGIYQLGGMGMFFSSKDLQIGRGETIHDTAKVLSRYVDGIMARTFAYQTVLDLAKYSSVPVINGLTDYDHPCQILADLFTIYEKRGVLKGLTLAYIGDGNNVLHSLIQGCVKVGMNITYASPSGYTPLESVVTESLEVAKQTGSKIFATQDPVEAVKNADVIYTDVWISMGQEDDKAKRLADLKAYQLNSELLSHASKEVLVMHCLPAHRGEEITDEVIDGPNSIVFDEAENRLHTQKAIMKLLMS
ncbi:MAG: ornithine carbamoyltransferase [Ignavibacteriae bacterium]|nr:MAG: ornithine carbamoyltransferase [Ignavibacteriota bacterium]